MATQNSKKIGTFFRLLSLLKPYWWAMVLVVIGFAINAATEAGVAYLMKFIIDAIGNGNRGNLNFFPLLIIGLFVARGFGTFLGNYFSAHIARNLVYTLRVAVFDKLLTLPNAYFLTHSPGVISSKLIYDVEQVTAASTDALKTLVRDGLTVLVLFSYLFYLNWRLTMILIVILPFVGALVRYASKQFHKLSHGLQQSMGEVSHITNEVVTGYDVVKNFGGQLFERKRFNAASLKNLRQAIKIVVVESINTPLVQLILACAMCIVVWIALRPEVLGDTSAGEFVQYITLAGLLSKPVRALTQVNEKIQRGIAGADSIFSLLDTPSELDNGTITPTLKGNISFKQVDLVYESADATPEVEAEVATEENTAQNNQTTINNTQTNDAQANDTQAKSTHTKALNDFNLSIKAGQTVAFVGRSGAGKTSLINLLTRTFDTTSGEVLLDDISITDIGLCCLREQIASVSQKVTLFAGSIKNNIAYGSLADKSDEEVVAAAKAAFAHDFIESLPQGYDTELGSQGQSLSGGQRQRIAIARALLKDAPILILDEATSALDNESEHYIQQALDNAMTGRTTLVIAHRLSTVENADLIVVMDKGSIVEQGTHAELMDKNGLYASMYIRNFDEIA